ncbi:MAG: hypothetical protein HY033_01730 [Ignavibacteriae bacterium]|nr:hypothetical protein [Ignavibacteria bacterium]MBI3363607.1 hypothetical protein [Ignavibacteriota bacterium]
MINTLSFTAFVFLSAVLSSCRDSSTVTQPSPNPYFILKWTYAIYDSVANTPDTLEIHAIDSTRLPNGLLAAVLEYRYRTFADTVLASYDRDTISIYGIRSYPFPLLVFVLPFEVGRGWRTPYSDSFHVAAKETVTVPAGTFTGAYRISRIHFEGNFYGGTTYWVDPSVGILRMHEQWFVTITNARRNTVWNLLRYSLAK